MTARTMERSRAWAGPALLSFGFRPFFLGAALWAILAMALWIGLLTGRVPLAPAFDPVSWHAHALLFGYLGAVVAGFLLTAVPNWTGRMPVVGRPLGALAALWLAGRLAVTAPGPLGPLTVAAIDLAFPLALAAVIAREIAAGRNWRNLPVLALLAALIAANALFHWEAARGLPAAQGHGLRLGLAAALMMIALIGGRIVPSFTRNWLARRGPGALPAPPMGRFDKIALAATLAALLLWVVWPEAAATGAALLALAALQAARLVRWRGWRTGPEPLVLVLHAAYALVPLGAGLMGAAILAPGALLPAAAQHVWMAGAIGLMTLAVMTRATLGHTGRALHAGAGTSAIYAALLLSVALRVAGAEAPGAAAALYAAAGACWILAFGGFAALYGPLLARPKPGAARG